jgi:lipid A ethanolaminephosphotransferase
METTFSEASELISASFLLHLFFFGLVPSVIIAFTQPRYEAIGREALKRGTAVLIALLMIVVSFFLFNKQFTFLFRQHPELRSLMNPTYPVYAFAKYMNKDPGNAQIQPLGLDARQTHAGSVRVKRTLLVIVVGETARAENFALNGYQRDTNPQLGKADIINFSNTYSCGTDTVYSVPCMFSPLSRRDYTPSKAARQETLLDVLTHAGVDVLWLDNNSGCKGVCDRVKHESVADAKHPTLCNTEECYDEILLYKLKDRIVKASSDLVVILHQKGSHGPSYYKRIPEEYRKFTPECRSVNLQDCTTSGIVNSYDNTILYTDHFLYSVIGFLKGNATHFDTAMIYMSDHGESLGENGLYLHGFPYALAPDTQIHIPFISWISKEYSDDFGIDINCLMKDRERRYSHDNLFHSVLGLLQVNSETYDPELDVFSACKKRTAR